MKKLALAFVFGTFLAGIVPAQETSTSSGPTLTGTVTTQIGTNNLFNSPFVAVPPGLNSNTSTTAVSSSLTGGINLPGFERVGYEMSATVDLANLYQAAVPAVKPPADDGNNNFYSRVQPMIDWYENNKVRYGLPNNPFGGAGWPSTSYGSFSGRYRFLYGSTAEPATSVTWNEAKWSDAYALYKDLKDKISTAIEGISPDFQSGASPHLDQFVYQNLPSDRKKAALNEQRAYNDFQAILTGTSPASSGSSGPVLTAAWVKLTNLLGWMDFRLDAVNASLSTGDLILSPRAAQPANGALGTLSLTPGSLGGFEASLAGNAVGGTSQTVENFDTRDLEYTTGDPAWVGAKASLGYRWRELMPWTDLEVVGSVLLPDAVTNPTQLASSFHGELTKKGELSSDVTVEVDYLAWSDRNLSGGPVTRALGAGLGGWCDFLGIRPHTTLKWKGPGYGGYGGNLTDDRFSGIGLDEDFNTAKVRSALSFDGGLLLNPQAVLGKNLCSLDLGTQYLIYDGQALGSGYYAALTLAFQDTLDLPVTLKGNLGNYKNKGTLDYQDASALPEGGPLSGLTWGLVLTVQPSSHFTVSLEFAGQDSTVLTDTSKIVPLVLTATLQF